MDKQTLFSNGGFSKCAKKRTTTNLIRLVFLLVVQFNVLSLCGQFKFEAGVNVPFSEFITLGAGTYIEPKYQIREDIDLGLHAGILTYVGPDNDKNNRRITSGTLPVLATSFMYRIPMTNSRRNQSFIGRAPGAYLTKGINFRGGIKPGVGLRFGAYLGRSSLGFVYHVVDDFNFFQLNYGFMIIR